MSRDCCHGIPFPVITGHGTFGGKSARPDWSLQPLKRRLFCLRGRHLETGRADLHGHELYLTPTRPGAENPVPVLAYAGRCDCA